MEEMTCWGWCHIAIHLACEFGIIRRVANNRVSNGKEMDADLVLSTGFWLGFDAIKSIKTLCHFVFGDRSTNSASHCKVAIDDCLLVESEGLSYGRIDDSFWRCHVTVHDTEVGFLDGTLFEEVFEGNKRCVCFCKEANAGGVLVKTMHDTGTQHVFADGDDVRIASHKPVGDRFGALEVVWVHGDTGWLVDDAKVFVFKKDFDREVRIGKENGIFYGWLFDKGNIVTVFEDMARFGRETIDKHETLLNGVGALGTTHKTRFGGKSLLHKKAIESLIGFVIFDNVFKSHKGK